MEQTTRAPQLESPLGWLNTDRPLRFGEELRGQVVVLDFWTYCCINCIHILPDLKYLEAKYAEQPVVIIGVHSAKFTNEASRQTIRAAIHRYEIEHPVIIDDQMKLWQAYTVRSWPTFVIIDPEGYVAGSLSGEGNREALDRAVGDLLERHADQGTLAAGPPSIRRDAFVPPAGGLAFPGKILADAESERIYIADSNHNRIVVTDWPDDGGRCSLIKSVGTGAVGAQDGPCDEATFDHPQGLAVNGDTLYVADTENHLIRAIDTDSWNVTTVVGTGEMGTDRAGGGMGVQQPISSPWDLAVEGGTLYVAMAGIHQIWRIEMPIGFARALAGSGRENIVDGPVESAALSQPSGLCLHRGKLYVADSEVSALREIDLAAEQVSTLIGSGLFVFGDVDGPFKKARLQHCLGVAAWGDKLLVADTYNHKIKLIDLEHQTSETLFGLGRPGTSDGDGRVGLFEPGGLCVAGDDLFVADTNNHRIVRVNIKTRVWTELIIDELRSPMSRLYEPTEVINLPETTLSPERAIEIRMDIALPAGSHLNAEAPWSARATIDGKASAQQTGHADSLPLTMSVNPPAGTETSVWEVSLSAVACSDGEASVCMPCEASWRIPVRYAAGAGSLLELQTSTHKDES